jgi:hypothetical protein
MRRSMPLSVTAAVALGGTILAGFLLRLYAGNGATRGVLRPEDLGGYTRRGLILSSVLSLFLELMLIRWISPRSGFLRTSRTSC